MARNTETIKKALENSVSADATLSSQLTSVSASSIWKLWMTMYAKAVNAFEAVVDTFRAANETALSSATVGSSAWLKQKVLEFQYGDSLKYDSTNNYAYYETVDTSKRVVTFCSVLNASKLNYLFSGNGLTVNASKGTIPTELSTDERDALEGYVKSIISPGVLATVKTGSADLVAITCEIRYNARYSETTLKDNVYAAIRNYIQNLPDMNLIVGELFSVIDAVEGVNWIKMQKVTARASSGSATTIFEISSSTATPTTAVQVWSTLYGYMIEETNTGETWNDTITFTPETL